MLPVVVLVPLVLGCGGGANPSGDESTDAVQADVEPEPDADPDAADVPGRDVEASDAFPADLAGDDTPAPLDVASDMVGATLTGANLISASFLGADLTNAYLVNSSLQGTVFDGARLQGARLGNAAIAFAQGSLSVTRLGDNDTLQTVTQSYAATSIPPDTTDASTFCPNGGQSDDGNAWCDSVAELTAHSPPSPPACIPSLTQFCPRARN